jgi:hypothetical protein
MTGEYLTIAEIETKYPNAWVILDGPKTTKYQEVLGGMVVFHTADRDELDRRLDEFGHVTRGAIFYTGKPDPDEVWMLNL